MGLQLVLVFVLTFLSDFEIKILIWLSIVIFSSKKKKKHTKNQLLSVYLQYGEEQTITVLLLQGQQAEIDAHAAFLVVRRRRRRQKQYRSIWVLRWLSAERRQQYDQYDRLMAELLKNGRSAFVFQLPVDATKNVGWTAEQSWATDSNERHVMYKNCGIRFKACNNFATLSYWGQVPDTAIWFPSSSKQFRLSFQSCARQLLRSIRMKLLLALLPQMNSGI